MSCVNGRLTGRTRRNGFGGIVTALLVSLLTQSVWAGEPVPRVYRNQLTPIAKPAPILADYPEFVQPVMESRRFEAPILVDDFEADLSVRAWRFSYNARGIIEVPNRLNAARTAIIVVHPWGIDDGQGWRSPEPAGVAFACTPEKNRMTLKHAERVINPFLKRHRSQVGLVLYSLPGPADPIRTKVYRSTMGTPTVSERTQAQQALTEKLNAFEYRGAAIPAEIPLTTGKPVVDYFRQFPGLDAGDRYNNAGFWKLPIPVMNTIDVAPDDVVLYDEQGYSVLKEFLQQQGIEHVLLCGYATDMCVCRTTAGYENLRRDFNVFLVGDATQATLPANNTSRYATNQSLSYASLDLFITQVSWVRSLQADVATKP